MSLLRHLKEQRARLEALLELFSDEQTQLIAGQPDGEALQRIAKAKTQLLSAIDASEASRRRVQHRLGYSPDARGARQAAREAGCETQWQALLSLTAEVARINERHGRLIELRMRHNRQVLDYIQGIAEKRVYSASGRPQASSGRLNTSA